MTGEIVVAENRWRRNDEGEWEHAFMGDVCWRPVGGYRDVLFLDEIERLRAVVGRLCILGDIPTHLLREELSNRDVNATCADDS